MAAEKQQFQLPVTVTTHGSRKLGKPHGEAPKRTCSERIAAIDQVLSTHDVERITGKHRCTIWRWVLAGTFPPKRAGGGCGWLRSDVERWLQGDKLTDRLRDGETRVGTWRSSGATVALDRRRDSLHSNSGSVHRWPHYSRRP